MVCVQKNSVYALVLGFVVCMQGITTKVSARGEKDDKINNPSLPARMTSPVSGTEFQWADHKTLSWDDFKGPVRASDEESAAATHCGMGFRINGVSPAGKPDVTVYNTFYVKKSWVRSDARIESILFHEQGHFDLCELFTRKLKARIETLPANVPDVKEALLAIFSEVNNEYEMSQQAYEDETIHGTNFAAQSRWMEKIGRELSL